MMELRRNKEFEQSQYHNAKNETVKQQYQYKNTPEIKYTTPKKVQSFEKLCCLE